MPDLQITRAHPADLPWCARLMASSEPWLTLGRDYDACLARCRAPELTPLIAHDPGGAPLGFLLLHLTGCCGAPYIATIAISPEHRGQGIGARLVDAAERHVPHARHIFLCVSSFNTGARRLYERLGYQQVGELPAYVIPEASEILMHKRLARP